MIGEKVLLLPDFVANNEQSNDHSLTGNDHQPAQGLHYGLAANNECSNDTSNQSDASSQA